MTTDKQWLLDWLQEQQNKAPNIHIKKVWIKRRELLEKGYCPTCEQELPEGHRLK